MELDKQVSYFLHQALSNKEVYGQLFLVVNRNLYGKVSTKLTALNRDKRPISVRCLFVPKLPDFYQGLVLVPFHALGGVMKVCKVSKRYISSQFRKVKHGS